MVEIVGEKVDAHVGHDFDDLAVAEAGIAQPLDIAVGNLAARLCLGFPKPPCQASASPDCPRIASESSGEKVAEVYPISADKDIEDRCVIFLRNSFAQRHPSGKPFNKVGTLLPKNKRLHSDFRVLKTL